MGGRRVERGSTDRGIGMEEERDRERDGHGGREGQTEGWAWRKRGTERGKQMPLERSLQHTTEPILPLATRT